MAQPSTTKKAQDEAKKNDTATFSHPHSSTQHKQGHRRSHQHHEAQPHDESHHQAEPHHRDPPQYHGRPQKHDVDFYDNVSSHQTLHAPQPHHLETPYHGRSHHTTAFVPRAPSTSTAHIHYSQHRGFDGEHGGSRRHLSRHRRHGESPSQEEARLHDETHHHRKTHHHGGQHHQDEPHDKDSYLSDAPYGSNEAYHGPHRYASQYDGQHLLEASYSRRSLYYEDTNLDLPELDSYQYDTLKYPTQRAPDESEQYYAPYHSENVPYDDRYADHPQVVSRDFSTLKSHRVVRSPQASRYSRASAQKRSSPFSLAHSHSTFQSHGTLRSSRIHPQDSSSRSLDDWSEDDELLQKRKTRLLRRSHQKQIGFCYWLWEKISDLFHELRILLSTLTESLAFEVFIFLIIFLNTIMLVAQTFAEVEVRGEWYFLALDSVFLSIYLIEAVLKIIVQGFSYFFDSWNKLDFLIVVMAVVDFLLMQVNTFSYHFIYNQSIFRILKVFKSLRALRAFRVLRRLSFLTSLQEVTGTLARTLPSITAILILMFTCLFLFSVMLRALFHQYDHKRFSNIFSTIFTLFTMLTLDDWSLIYLDNRAQGAWYIIPILMVYIIIQYFIFLNLVIAVLVDNFQMALLKGLEKVKQERAAQIHEKLLDDSLTELDRTEPKEVVSEITRQKQLLEKKFGVLTERQQQLLFQFLQLVAGVEHHQQKFRSQASVIDEIVDTAFEAGEEDFRK